MRQEYRGQNAGKTRIPGDRCRSSWTSGVGTCGDPWIIDEMLTLNLTLGYRFKSGLRLRGSIINLEDTRAPLADEYRHAHVSDVHNDYGRRYSVEFYRKF